MRTNQNLIITKQELIQNPKNLRPHVVLLGAGASRAAFPNGDANGRKLPLMSDLVDILNLAPTLKKNGLESTRNFEELYSEVTSNEQYATLQQDLERTINNYFSALALPDSVTHYDRLLLSLREKDAIFTFNWDPFLFDAYQRNQYITSLPEIFFLHGNVRIGVCLEHEIWVQRGCYAVPVISHSLMFRYFTLLRKKIILILPI